MAKKTDGNGKDKPPFVEIYFDSRDGSYWFKVNGRYLKLGTRDLRMHLRASHGLRDDIYTQTGNGSLRETDFPLFDAQNNRVVDYAGALAGHRMGVHKNTSGNVFLVTQEPSGLWDNLPKKPKAPKFFKSFVEELLAGDQWLHFCHWLRFALASFRACDFKPGQVCVFAGPSQCGKSLLQFIITEVLGGRQANPFAYMMGEKFNYELGGAEHWCMEDPASTTDIRARRFFGAKLKELTVNSTIAINQKGKDALLLLIARRGTISVNDEPENLLVIPPLDDSIIDKINLYKCTPVVEALKPFLDDDGHLDRNALKKAIQDEIPQIRAWLLNGIGKLPADLRDVRFGIKSFQHAELVGQLQSLSPEARLLSLMDEVLFKAEDGEVVADFDGKAIEIEKALRDSKFVFEADKILRYNGACGAYLSRLAKQHPDRISTRLLHGSNVWTIKKPTTKKEEQNHE
jgi:hypothetical protein